jgi:hypothetical protein
MKRFKNWIVEGGIIPLLFGFMILSFLGATAWKVMSVANNGVSKYSTTFANSQRDTVVFRRDGVLTNLSFAVHYKDSVSLTEVYVRRMVGGEFTADSTRLVGATTNFAAGYQGTSANPSFAASYNITLAPFCDSYVVIVVHAASNNGVTSPNVDYFMEAQVSEE